MKELTVIYNCWFYGWLPTTMFELSSPEFWLLLF
jgi:hypothetical protein